MRRIRIEKSRKKMLSKKLARAWATYLRRMKVKRKARSIYLRAEREQRYALERILKIQEEEKTDGK